MKIFEIGTGYTSIPARIGAATEIVVEELTRSLLKLKYDVSIVDIKDKNRKPSDLPIIKEVYLPQFFNRKDIKLGILHKVKRVLYSLSLCLSLKKLIKAENGKIVLHFHNQYNLYAFLKLTSGKLRSRVYIAYTNHSYIWQGDWAEIKETIHKRYFQEVYCVQKADAVFVLNEQTKANLIKQINVPQERVKLIPNGVNTSVYYIKSKEEKGSLKKQNELEDKTVFIQVGSICERKGQLAAIQLLLPFLKSKEKEYVFIYAGGIISEEYKQRIDKYAHENQIQDQVIYLGELMPGKELNDYYNISSALMFPSLKEGFSLVVLEALAAGLPVFANINNGLKLPECCLTYRDADDFVRLVNEKLLNQAEYQNVVKTSRTLIESEYSWDAVAQIYVDNFN